MSVFLQFPLSASSNLLPSWEPQQSPFRAFPFPHRSHPPEPVSLPLFRLRVKMFGVKDSNLCVFQFSLSANSNLLPSWGPLRSPSSAFPLPHRSHRPEPVSLPPCRLRVLLIVLRIQASYFSSNLLPSQETWHPHHHSQPESFPLCRLRVSLFGVCACVILVFPFCKFKPAFFSAKLASSSS